ncbi:hypothetical protein GCM10011571_28040 [Marinithermofilum abyssi]|uniref:Uncharacterized protein n=1 Tax=Marinithermofilum abyssi TaxID=1571185 RepID=A0A8J2VFY9_9BACL|nr:hypothetical protein GCM10011571_28040 [Marinithermofilum abyssi]
MKKSKRSTHGNSIGGGGEHDDANRCKRFMRRSKRKGSTVASVGSMSETLMLPVDSYEANKSKNATLR